MLAVLLAAALSVFARPAAATGALDPSFDGDGVRVDDFGGGDVARGVAVQPDGRIVVAGTGCGGDILVARYLVTGAPDTSLGGDGSVCVDVGGGTQDDGEEVLLAGDGRILVAGTSGGDFALVRLSPEGGLDVSFDGDGKATYDFGATDRLRDAAMAPDGRIVLVGEREKPGCLGIGPGTVVDQVVARVTSGGALDPTFSGDGKVVIETGEVGRALAVAVQLDGAVVVGGRISSCSRVRIEHSLLRLTPAGERDATFPAAPIPFADAPDTVADIAVQGDGKLVVVIDTFVGIATSPARNDAFVVVRLHPDGRPDLTFGGGDGEVSVLFGQALDATAAAVVLQANGKIVVGGSVRPAAFPGGPGDFALARLNPDGSPDTTFDSDGRVVTDLGGNDLLHALALQSDGRLVAAGSSDDDVALARYLTAPAGPAVVAGAAFYIDGTSARSGPPGARVSLFATGAEPGFGYTLVSGRTGASGRPCSADVVPVNDAPKFANAQGVIGQTAGFLYRPTGEWQICFLDEGRVVTGAATFTVTH